MNREEIILQASELVYKHLEVYKLLPEGRRKKQLSTSTFIEGLIYNCIIDILHCYGIKSTSYYYMSDYITPEARKIYKNQNNMKGLIREHMIPKNMYYKTIVQESENNTLTVEKISKILNKYYWTCLVVKEAENRILDKYYKSKMPDDWDGMNIFARYDKVSIEVVGNEESVVNQFVNRK